MCVCVCVCGRGKKKVCSNSYGSTLVTPNHISKALFHYAHLQQLSPISRTCVQVLTGFDRLRVRDLQVRHNSGLRMNEAWTVEILSSVSEALTTFACRV